jgi:hypothetical protein
LFSFLSFWHSEVLCPLQLQCMHFLLLQSRSQFQSHLHSFPFPHFAAFAKNVLASSPEDWMRHASSAKI